MSNKNPSSVRVRFAPSPTGYLHIGGLRSALFNWLWARHNHGAYVLRIEDTDRTRLVEDSLNQILKAQDDLGIIPDEGPTQGGAFDPYVQSERLSIYHDQAKKLLKTGALYRCWCSPERLTKLREDAQKTGVAFKYDRHCLAPENHKSESEPHVLRFRIPDEPAIVAWDDAVRGQLEFKSADLDDFVAVKADGYPTYQFANVVDDHLMEISHVLRADEWIPSTPKHLLLYRAFGWKPPIFAHLPAVQGATGGKKLSKRDSAKSVQEFVSEGYLPEALRSFLATLGWNDGTTQEVYTTNELIAKFTLDRIQKSPARFDLERLTWVNGKTIRDLWRNDPDELVRRCEPFWPPKAESTSEYRNAVLGLVQDRLRILSELPELTEFFFTDPLPDIKALTKNYDASIAHELLEKLTSILDPIPAADWTIAKLEPTIRQLAGDNDLKPGQFFGLIRVTITGRTAAPGLFETLAVLKKPTVMRRLTATSKMLAN